jgi:TIGR03009 family protein
MRYSLLTLLGILIAVGTLTAQQPTSSPADPPLDPARNKLDALLLKWEEKMKGVETLYATVRRTKLDYTYPEKAIVDGKPVFVPSKEIFEGTAKYMKPNLARIELYRKDKPTVYEKYIFTPTFVYEFNPGSKEIRAHEVPPAKPGQMADDNLLSFLLGMKAAEAKKRYDLRLAPEDQYYYYVEVFPRLQDDKAQFEKAQLALVQTTMLPRQVVLFEPATKGKGNQVTWDIPTMELGARLNRSEFEAPKLPGPDWRLVRAPKINDNASKPGVAPRVVRPKS